jgi:hypothetical protein
LRAVPSWSDAYAVLEVNDAASEPALVEELELHADVLGSARLPPPTTIGARNRWH